MKKLVLFMIMALLVAVPAFAGVAEDEMAVARVLEDLAVKRAVGDMRGASGLYTEDAILRFFYGPNNAPMISQGRLKIYIAFSVAGLSNFKYSDIMVTKAEGDNAEAKARYSVKATGIAMTGLKTADIFFKLRRETDGQWRISLEEQRNPLMLLQQ